MTETFLFVRFGEGEVYRNVVWKLQKCHDRVGGDGFVLFHLITTLDILAYDDIILTQIGRHFWISVASYAEDL